MPYKDLEKRRAKRREWYSKNKTSEKQHVYRRRKEILNWFEEYKKRLKCLSCGEDHPSTLDFHQKDRNSKDFSINFLVHNGYSLELIKKELEKCEVLCANCHRKVHYKTAIFKRA
jgi:transcription elongation factor Elf1